MRKFAFLLLFFITPLAAQAQIDYSLYTDPGVQIESSPEVPGPDETTKLSLTDYERRFFGARIAWYKNNELIPGTEGQREITITTGAVGSKDTIKAVFTLTDNSTYVVSRTFQPVYLDIILEPQTHVPDFYTGRALPSVGSRVFATAIVSDGAIINDSLIYHWKINQDVVEGGAIRGRNKVVFTTPQGSELFLSLEVSRSDGTPLAKRLILVPVARPELHFYEVNELYGVSKQSVTSLTLFGSGTVLRAEPFYLSSEVFNTPSVIEWSVDGRKTKGSGGNPYQITIQSTGEAGQASVGFRVQSTTQFLQGAQGGITISI